MVSPAYLGARSSWLTGQQAHEMPDKPIAVVTRNTARGALFLMNPVATRQTAGSIDPEHTNGLHESTALLNMHHLTCGISSLCQPHSVHSPPGSPHPAHINIITVTTFVLTIYHFLDLSLQSKNSSVSQILFSIVFLVPFGVPSRISDLDQTYWAVAFVSFSFFFLYFRFGFVC